MPSRDTACRVKGSPACTTILMSGCQPWPPDQTGLSEGQRSYTKPRGTIQRALGRLRPALTLGNNRSYRRPNLAHRALRGAVTPSPRIRPFFASHPNFSSPYCLSFSLYFSGLDAPFSFILSRCILRLFHDLFDPPVGLFLVLFSCRTVPSDRPVLADSPACATRRRDHPRTHRFPPGPV